MARWASPACNLLCIGPLHISIETEFWVVEPALHSFAEQCNHEGEHANAECTNRCEPIRRQDSAEVVAHGPEFTPAEGPSATARVGLPRSVTPAIRRPRRRRVDESNRDVTTIVQAVIAD